MLVPEDSRHSQVLEYSWMGSWVEHPYSISIKQNLIGGSPFLNPLYTVEESLWKPSTPPPVSAPNITPPVKLLLRFQPHAPQK